MATETEQRLAAYKAAELEILQGQSVKFSASGNDRELRMADLAEVREAIKDLEAQVSAESRSAVGAFGPVLFRGGFG